MAVNKTHHSMLKIFLVLFLFLTMASGLAAALMMSQETQSVASQASVKKGVVQVALLNATNTPVVNKDVVVDLQVNSNEAVVNTATLGIRFKGGVVKNLTFVPRTNSILKQTENISATRDHDGGINLTFAAPAGKAAAIPVGTIVGQLTFTPTTSGQLTLYFDSEFSHVYSTAVKSTVPSPSPLAYPKYQEPNKPARGSSIPKASVVPTPSPVVNQVQDLLQTPKNVVLNILSSATSVPNPSSRPTVTPTAKPSASPTVMCLRDSDCGAGSICFQPPMPVCPKGMMCAQVMPPKECKKNSAIPTPSPVPMPVPVR